MGPLNVQEKKLLHNCMLLKAGVMLSVEHVAPKKDLVSRECWKLLSLLHHREKNLLRLP